MNILDLIEESSSLDDLHITQTRIKLENLLPDPVNNNNYNDIRYNLDEVEAKYFQGFWQISNQSAEIDDEGKDENLDSKKIKIIQESSKDYKDENNISEIKEEKKYLIEKKEEENIFKLEKIPKSEKLSDNLFKKIKNEKYNFGRKKKTDNHKRKHNKSCEDNIIIKIKGYFFNFVRDITNKNFNNKSIYFRKIPYKFISNLTKNDNERLIDMEMKDILCEIPITTKNKKSSRFENKFIIEKLYFEGEEKKVIQILDLTFRELFIIFRRNLNFDEDKEDLEKIAKRIEDLDLLENNNYKDINNLINRIRKKSEKIDEDTETEMTEDDYEEYIQEMQNLCCNYQKWFNKKIGRNSKKIKINCGK